jgi:hypothetical protein
LKGSKDLQHYLLFYSGVPIEKRASSRTTILINKKYKNRIHSYTFENDRIVNLRIKTARGYLLLGYTPPKKGKKKKVMSFIRFFKDIWIQ